LKFATASFSFEKRTCVKNIPSLPFIKNYTDLKSKIGGIQKKRVVIYPYRLSQSETLENMPLNRTSQGGSEIERFNIKK
jgi:hypothetical protein